MENKNPNQQKLNTRFLQSFQKNVLKIFQKRKIRQVKILKSLNIQIHGLKKTSTCKNHWDLKPINYKINFNQYPKKFKNKKKIKY